MSTENFKKPAHCRRRLISWLVNGGVDISPHILCLHLGNFSCSSFRPAPADQWAPLELVCYDRTYISSVGIRLIYICLDFRDSDSLWPSNWENGHSSAAFQLLGIVLHLAPVRCLQGPAPRTNRLQSRSLKSEYRTFCSLVVVIFEIFVWFSENLSGFGFWLARAHQ